MWSINRKSRASSALRRVAWLALLVGGNMVQQAASQEQKAAGTFECLIQPNVVLKLGTPVPGLIGEMLVDRGVMVKKGDVLARLESSVEEAAMKLAQARSNNDAGVRSGHIKLGFQQRKFERAQQLRRND